MTRTVLDKFTRVRCDIRRSVEAPTGGVNRSRPTFTGPVTRRTAVATLSLATVGRARILPAEGQRSEGWSATCRE